VVSVPVGSGGAAVACGGCGVACRGSVASLGGAIWGGSLGADGLNG